MSVQFNFSADLPPFQKGALRAPRSGEPEGLLDRLVRLQPHLGSTYVRVPWDFPELPSPPSAMVSFRDAFALDGRPLLAVVCESGRLIVADADEPKDHRALQLPGIAAGRAEILGLWASKALRPFGRWVELLVLVEARRGGKAEKRFVYRALTRWAADGKVALKAACEDGDDASVRWPQFAPPPLLRRPDVRRVRFAAGVDAFGNHALESVPVGSQELRTDAHALRIEGGFQLRPAQPSAAPNGDPRILPAWFRAGALRATDADAPLDHPVLLLDDQHLTGWRWSDGSWQPAWRQKLPKLPRVIEAGWGAAADGSAPTAAPWPVLFIGLDDRRVQRLAYVPEGRIDRAWQLGLERLRPHLTDAHFAAFVDQYEKKLDEIEPRVSVGARQRRQALLDVLAALALQQPLAREAQIRRLGRLLCSERGTSVLLATAHRLFDGLRD
ncbi:MAG: hypothetical protein AAF772_15665, partial [Acidobacteriota bacterium]